MFITGQSQLIETIERSPERDRRAKLYIGVGLGAFAMLQCAATVLSLMAAG
jgi:hypothetical protein